jgi:hypothetical protein
VLLCSRLLLRQARLALDTEAAATRLVVLKLHYPRADLTRIMQRQPHLLLQDVAVLEDNAKQVGRLPGAAASCIVCRDVDDCRDMDVPTPSRGVGAVCVLAGPRLNNCSSTGVTA